MVVFYEDYDQVIRLVCPDYDYCLNLIAENIPVKAGSVLDLGSGTGNLALSILKHHPKVRIYGIELQKRLVELARKKLAGYNASFVEGDILSFDWPSADCVVSSLALHHLSHVDKRKVFTRIRRTSHSFIYFDRVKGADEKEEEENLAYLLGYMKKRGFSEEMLAEAREEMAAKDNPLTKKALNSLLDSLRFRYRILYLNHGLAVYHCTRKE